MVQLAHLYMTTGKNISLTRWSFVGTVMFLLFNTLSGSVIAFLPRSKHLLISWLQSPSIVILEPKRIKSVNVSIFPPFICHEMLGLDAMILVFWMLSVKLVFSLSSFTFIKMLFSSSLICTLRWCHLPIWGCWYFSQQSWLQLVVHSAQHLTLLYILISKMGLPSWLNGKEPPCQCRRHGFDPWVGKIPWRRKWHPSSVSSPGKFHGQRSLVGYSPWGHMTKWLPTTELARWELKV